MARSCDCSSPLGARVGVLDIDHDGIGDDIFNYSILLDACVRTLSKVPNMIGLSALLDSHLVTWG